MEPSHAGLDGFPACADFFKSLSSGKYMVSALEQIHAWYLNYGLTYSFSL